MKKHFEPMNEESSNALKEDFKRVCYEALKKDEEIAIPQFIDGCVAKYINTMTNTTPNDAFWIEEAFENAMAELLQEGLYVMCIYHVPENKPRFFIDICYKVVDLVAIIEVGDAKATDEQIGAFKRLTAITARKAKIAAELESEAGDKENDEPAETEGGEGDEA